MSGGGTGRRTVEGDVRGMVKELRKLSSTTFPQNFESDCGWDTERGSASSQGSSEQVLALGTGDLHASSRPCSSLSDAAAEEARDVLECAEEFLLSAKPVLTVEPVEGEFTGACISLQATVPSPSRQRLRTLCDNATRPPWLAVGTRHSCDAAPRLRLERAEWRR